MKPGSVVVGYLDPGTWSAVFGLSYRDLILHDALTSQRIVREGGKELRALTGSGGLSASRNKVSRDFLDNTDGEWLFFIDSDMGFAPDTVDRLVESADNQHPVMGGLCFAQKKLGRGPFNAERYVITPTLYQYVEEDGEVGFRPVRDYPRDEVEPVAGTGAACLLIHREALKKVRGKYGDEWFSEITHPTGDKGRPRRFSEDLSFCVRLQACDIPVHVNTAVKTCHEKGGIFLDEEMYDRDQAFARFQSECVPEPTG